MKKCLLLLFFSLSLRTANAQTISDSIKYLMNYYHENGLFNGSILVARSNEVIYKGACGMANYELQVPNTPQTKFRLGSLTKQFTSMLILQLVQEGKLSIDGKITDYLPNYRKQTGNQVTIHHLLSHSSGIPNYTDQESFLANSVKPYTVEDFIRLYCSGDLEFPPGSQFSYSNSGYFILGGILEKLTGKPYEELLQERIFIPLGMRSSGLENNQELIPERAAGYEPTLTGFKNAPYLDMGQPYAAGSLYSTVEDLMIWNQSLYKNQLLSDSLKVKMFAGYYVMEDENLKAGYGWFNEKLTTPDSSRSISMIWHSGGINGFSTELARFPDDGYFVVVLDNTSNNTSQIFRDIIKLLYKLPIRDKKQKLAAAIQKKINNSTITEAVNYFSNLSESERINYDFSGSERIINRWGYQRMREKKDISGALKLFELNTKLFPGSTNVYDSYGEALGNAGHYQQAIESYRKSVQLDSNRYRRAQFYIDKFSIRADTLQVKVDGHEMVLYKAGTKGPVIVLEAGGNSDHTCWSNIIPELAKRAIVITYDRPGYLQSEQCAQPRTADRVAVELHEALAKAGIKGPYLLGGWSWGGAFVRAFAGKYPKDTRGLLLLDPASVEVYDRMAMDYPDEFTNLFIKRFTSIPAAQYEYDAMIPTMLQASALENNYKGKIELLVATSLKEWTQSEVPLKKAWISSLKDWAAKKKNVNIELLDCGHYIQREKPENVIAALNRLMLAP